MDGSECRQWSVCVCACAWGGKALTAGTQGSPGWVFLLSRGEASLDPAGVTLGSREKPWVIMPHCFSLPGCSALAPLQLSCVLVQCFASAACIMGGRQDGVPKSEHPTCICPTFLPLGNTNSLQIVDIAVSGCKPTVKKHL